MATITLGGREIEAIEAGAVTLEQDIFIMNGIRSSGLGPIEMRPGEDSDEFVDRLLTELVLSGRFFPIIAAYLVFAGEKWSVDKEQRDGMTAFLRGLTDQEDKAKMRGMIATLLLGFLQGAKRFSETSLNSSVEETAAPPEASSVSQ